MSSAAQTHFFNEIRIKKVDRMDLLCLNWEMKMKLTCFMFLLIRIGTVVKQRRTLKRPCLRLDLNMKKPMVQLPSPFQSPPSTLESNALTLDFQNLTMGNQERSPAPSPFSGADQQEYPWGLSNHNTNNCESLDDILQDVLKSDRDLESLTGSPFSLTDWEDICYSTALLGASRNRGDKRLGKLNSNNIGASARVHKRSKGLASKGYDEHSIYPNKRKVQNCEESDQQNWFFDAFLISMFAQFDIVPTISGNAGHLLEWIPKLVVDE
ncbi:hypothetical protein BC833DRAFT_655909 [Globomyces pollinis-pini]|nr:hypothetical protein BC833DRAFT_655909 [Globomyces pollinis-pini]